MAPNGLLVVRKPGGWTSHDVVAKLRRLTGQRRIGHAGTLDPAATGVLVVCVGTATRLIEYLTLHDKLYLAEIVLGVTTDTDDGEGAILEQRLTDVDAATFARALAAFRGEIVQRPPAYSAIKVGGQALYKAARAGREVEAPPRSVVIYDLTLVHADPPRFEVLVHCGKGTYIRSLARDLGETLDTGAYLHDLVRLRSGSFTLGDAVSLDDVARAAEQGALDSLIRPADEALPELPAAILDPARTLRLTQGMGIPLPAALEPGSLCRLYTVHGAFFGVGRAEGDQLRPEKILDPGAAGVQDG